MQDVVTVICPLIVMLEPAIAFRPITRRAFTKSIAVFLPIGGIGNLPPKFVTSKA